MFPIIASKRLCILPTGSHCFLYLSSENQPRRAHSRSPIKVWVRKEEKEAERWWEKAKPPEQSANAAHLQLLSFHLRRRERRLHSLSVLLHQVLQALSERLSELLLLLFRLMSDFMKVLFICLLQALCFTACSFLGL